MVHSGCYCFLMSLFVRSVLSCVEQGQALGAGRGWLSVQGGVGLLLFLEAAPAPSVSSLPPKTCHICPEIQVQFGHLNQIPAEPCLD